MIYFYTGAYFIISTVFFVTLQLIIFINPFLFLYGAVELYYLCGLKYPIAIWLCGIIFIPICTYINLKLLKRQFYYTPLAFRKNNIPKLTALVCEVCNIMAVKQFDIIEVVDDFDISTSLMGNKKIIRISKPALMYLSEAEIKAIVAHECGHHLNSLMLINRIHYRFMLLFNTYYLTTKNYLRFIDKTLLKKYKYIFDNIWGAIFILPTFLNILFGYIAFLYIKIIEKIFSYSNHKIEYYCDFVAAEKFGSNILSSALVKYSNLLNAHNFCIENKIEVQFENIEQILQKENNGEIDFIDSFLITTDTHPSTNSRLSKLREMGNIVLDKTVPLQ